VEATLGVVLKYQDDIARVKGETAVRGIEQAKEQAKLAAAQ
jgi:hypothetical protein